MTTSSHLSVFHQSSNPHYFVDHLNPPHNHISVKTEASASPDLSPAPVSLRNYQFKFHPPPQPPISHESLPTSRNHSQSPSVLPPQPIYRFGSGSASYSSMTSHHHTWPTSASATAAVSTNPSQHPSSRAIGPGSGSTANHHHFGNGSSHELASLDHSMSYSDEYDEVSELVDLPLGSQSGFAGLSSANGGNSSAGLQEKLIRRRSSKACDQCRKSKCKCERATPGEPCKSCVMLGTPCTFLGPSRKRGPPKGYIDAIEARLHQTEALLGIMLASNDDRAQTLLHDIAKDPLAKEIINRVDNSPYGVKGRRKDDSGPPTKTRHQPPHSDSSQKEGGNSRFELGSTHPSNEWQDRVTAMLKAKSRGRPSDENASSVDGVRERPTLRVTAHDSSAGTGTISDDGHSPGRRTRRRVEDGSAQNEVGYTGLTPISSTSRDGNSPRALAYGSRSNYSTLSPTGSYGINMESRRRSLSVDSANSEDEGDLTGAVGQLSLNEDEQVRYHGKASGLYLLGDKERLDARNEGGIWRFPKARVWPPLPSTTAAMAIDEETVQLPDRATQEHLLEVYFRYVHPSFPVIHKRALLNVFNATESQSRPDDSTSAEESDGGSNSKLSDTSKSPFKSRPRRIPALLLYAMYALAARYSDDESIPPKPTDGSMWEAGDDYLNKAKTILDGSYSSSRPTTVQALLLMGYREIGIGAMAQAWTYIGMAIRMAQDLGMHRRADGWARVGLGGSLFGDDELHERKRIWYACVIMDKYVSTYIGRPLMIFEQDFDTLPPSEDDPEEMEEWTSLSGTDNSHPPVPGRIISCFNASASLSNILSMIIQSIYAVRPRKSRHAEYAHMEGILDKWYIELPEHLRYDPGSTKTPPPPPHILTLHMQYWCAVLLLHRPFVRHAQNSKAKQSEDSDDEKTRAFNEKSYELCASAANHITSLVSTYIESYSLERCAVFLCYYVFTASIMHVISLYTYPGHPQALVGLAKVKDALEKMQVVWSSAARALELLRGSKMDLEAGAHAIPVQPSPERNKRSAEQSLDDSFDKSRPGQQRKAPSSSQARHQSTQPQSQSTPRPRSLPQPQRSSQQSSFVDIRSQPYNNSQYGGSMSSFNSPTAEMHTPQLPPPQSAPAAPVTSGSGSYFGSSYDRWTSEQNSSLTYPPTLSTSVLPQLYSTGFVDERSTPSSSSHRLHGGHTPSQGSNTHQHPQSTNQHTPSHHDGPNRYPPQYWNDFSTFSQLGPYPGGFQQQGQSQHQPQQTQQSGIAQPQASSQIYLPDQYNLYS